MKRAMVVAGVALALGAAGTSRGAVLLYDQFVDGGRTNGADAQDTDWWANEAGGTLSIVPNGADSGLQFNNTSLFRGAVGLFAPNATPVTLNVYDGLRLTAEFRFTANPASDPEGFKLGLFNSRSTQVTTDTPSADANDIGYAVVYHTGATVGSSIHGGDGSGSGQVGSGADFPVIATATVATPAFTVASGTHTGVLEIGRTNTTTLNIKGYVDSVKIVEWDDTTVLADATKFNGVPSFNEVFFGHGNFSGTSVLDNIKVETFAVPEPASLGLLGLSSLLLIGRRRRTAR